MMKSTSALYLPLRRANLSKDVSSCI